MSRLFDFAPGDYCVVHARCPVAAMIRGLLPMTDKAELIDEISGTSVQLSEYLFG